MTKQLPEEEPQATATAADKDILTREDLENGIKTYEKQDEPHAALETKEGKNNGAKPAAYGDQQSYHP